jgi:sigma-B regulation protein RsbU (phosphoserine phosphatase)
MAAALIMSNFRGLIQSEIMRRQDYSALFNSLNEMVHFDEELIQYLTGVFLHFDDSTKRLLYLNAGHYEPIVFNRSSCRSLPGAGPPLGMFKSSQYPVGQTDLQSGDLVALFTDGLVDIQNRSEEYFGTEGIRQAIQRNLEGISLEEIADRVLKAAQSFSEGAKIEDDLTLFLLRVR